MSESDRPTGLRVLVVDGANVVGSVPDGWWRDRAEAAARLHAGLRANLDALPSGAPAVPPYDIVELVLEGKARPGVPAGGDGRLVTVHARGEGDDEIVTRCRIHADAGAHVTVATADRGLVRRVEPLGVSVLGPRTLRAALR